MKTSVEMNRVIDGINFSQRTKDGFFCSSELLSRWNRITKGRKRQMSEFLGAKQTIEFLNVLNDDLAQNENSCMAFQVKKGRNTFRGKTTDEIWMHPYLFIKFAMWINPSFELQVIKFVYDELMKQRNDAGDNYKMLSSAGTKLDGYDFVEVAKAMQWIVFNKTGKGLRQTATQEQLSELNDIQTKLAFAIDMGYIDSYKKLIDEMKKLWKQKHRIAPF